MDVSKLVKKLTSPPKTGNIYEVGPEFLSSIETCLTNQHDLALLHEIFYYLFIDMKAKNGIIRLRALSVCNFLIHRYTEARPIVATNMKLVLRAAGLLRTEDAISLREDRRASHLLELEEKVKETVELWDHFYGSAFPQIRVAVRYLRETLRLQMPNVLSRIREMESSRARQEREEQNRTAVARDRLIGDTLYPCLRDYGEVLDQLDSYFALLFPTFKDSSKSNKTYDDDGHKDIHRGSSNTEKLLMNGHSTISDKKTDEHQANAGRDLTLTEGEGDGGLGEGDVAWEDAEESSEGSAEGPTEDSPPTLPAFSASGSAPFSIDITLSTSAKDLETPDNACLLQLIRETSSFLGRKVVPRVLGWQKVLTAALALDSKYLRTLRQQSHIQTQSQTQTPTDKKQSSESTRGVETSVVAVDGLVSHIRERDASGSGRGKKRGLSEGEEGRSHSRKGSRENSSQESELVARVKETEEALLACTGLLRRVAFELTGRCKALLQHS